MNLVHAGHMHVFKAQHVFYNINRCFGEYSSTAQLPELFLLYARGGKMRNANVKFAILFCKLRTITCTGTVNSTKWATIFYKYRIRMAKNREIEL